MLKKALIVVVALIAVVLAVAATRPSRFHIERSASIAAPPEVVFPLINDFHAWAQWSPYEKLDPAMTREFSGSPAGTGAAYAWSGNDEVGAGTMRITESQSPALVKIALEFLKPFQASNVATFNVQPEGAGSRVTWAMDGANPFGMKLASLFMDMDQMIGKDFEVGLVNLGALAQARAAH
jgi:uncharacterized protein YndB with AHSA1/START domain